MIKPLGNRLLIKPIKQKEIATNSGILVSEEIAPQSLKAEVVAIGDEVKDFEADDVILVSQFAPTQAKELPSDDTLIVPAEDILAVIVSA